MRSAVNQANQTFGTATNNSDNYGANASTISSSLVPNLLQKLNAPQGYSQQDMSAMIANAFGSSGGATSGITGQANLQAGRSRNDAGFSTALADAARQRTAAAAQASTGVATADANLKQQQSSDAAKMLSGLYGTDVGAQGEDLKTANDATQTGIQASQAGWLQNMSGVLNSLGQLSGGAGNILKGIRGK